MRRYFSLLALLTACSTTAPAATTETADVTDDATSGDATSLDAAADVSATDAGPHVTATTGVSLLYSQGIARVSNGWVFSAKAGLWRTDDAFTQVAEVINPLPQTLLDQGYGHIGDIDVADGKLYAGLEQGNYAASKQAVAWFDPQTLAYQGTVDLPQHENPCLCIDEATMIAYTPDRYHGTEIRRYDVKNGWKPLTPLTLSRQLDAMQGVDVADGALWFSCEDAVHGLYRADLTTGETVQIGSVGHLEPTASVMPEVEGIDASHTGSGFLHVLTNEPLQATSWVDDVAL